MPVQNRIVKIQRRNRALVRFDASRIVEAMTRAAAAKRSARWWHDRLSVTTY